MDWPGKRRTGKVERNGGRRQPAGETLLHNPHRSSPPPFSFSISPFTSLSYHPLLITGTEWAALLPKWLMGSTLYCPLWEGPSGQNYAVWDPHWVVMTGYGSACCPCCFQGHFIQVREKNGALRRSSCKSSAVRHRTETRGGGIYYLPQGEEPKPIWLRPNRIVPKMSQTWQERKWKYARC